MLKTLTAAITLAAILATTGTAHADDQTFINRLHNTQFVMPTTDGVYINWGHMVCDKLHHGAQPADLYSMFSFNQGPNVVDAAQHELCPDTLR